MRNGLPFSAVYLTKGNESESSAPRDGSMECAASRTGMFIVAHARTRASSVTSAAAMRPAQRARRVAACLDRGSLVTLGVLVNQIRGTLTTIV